MGYKILLVDDEPSIVFVLSERLKFNGYDVITAENGEDGLNKAKSEKPDLILLDVMMPNMNGYQVCRLLKFDNEYKHIPIIMLTARSQDADRKTAQDTGANAYLTKPVDSKELIETIQKFLPKNN